MTCLTLFATQTMSTDVVSLTLLRCGVKENQTCSKYSERGRIGNGDKVSMRSDHVDESLRKQRNKTQDIISSYRGKKKYIVVLYHFKLLRTCGARFNKFRGLEMNL